MNINLTSAEHVARVVLNLPEDSIISVDEALLEQFNCTLEQFHSIANALMPFTIPVRPHIDGEIYCGYVRDGAFMARLRVDRPAREIVKWNFP